MADDRYARFQHLTYEDFRRLAVDASLSQYERIGFPDSYREGWEEAIFRDIASKLSNLQRSGGTVLDIGPGSTGLPRMMVELCRRQGHKLILADSPEMLAYLPDEPFVEKAAGRYPRECGEWLEKYAGRVDAILSYSVFHYVFAEGNIFEFLDRSLELLAPGGQMLIGDIPNKSKRNRFFSSAAGIRCHRQFTGTDEVPEVAFNVLERGEIDDAVLVAMVMRCRGAGFDAYLVPQAEDLPMADRREDIFVIKP